MSTNNAISPEGGSYADYRQVHSYEADKGLAIAPSSNRTGTPRLLRLHGGYGKRVVDFNASRVETPPLLPLAADTEGDTLVSHTLEIPLPVFDQLLGRYNFKARGQYVYLQNATRVPGTDPFPTGRYPYPLEPADTLSMASTIAAIGNAALAVIFGGATPIASLTAALGATIDVTRKYVWYLTSLPSQTFTNLIKG